MAVLSAAPDIEVIADRARQAKPGRALLTVIAALLFGLGWGVRKLLRGLWIGTAWAWFAMDEGWRAAAKPKAPRRQ